MATIPKPWEKVSDPSYFRAVLGNMVALGFGPKHGSIAHTRFGNTGIGHAPHYQIEGEDGIKHCYNGLNHSDAKDVDVEFEPRNLSEECFTYADIQAMLARLTGGAPRQ
jgi:hypothetical protein